MPQPNAAQLDPIRKAAILIATLDHRVADQLLERMPDEQAARVREVAMELDEIAEEERELVLQEFLGSNGSGEAADDSGIELDEELARKLAARKDFVERSPAVADQEAPPFRFLCDAQTDAIAEHLRHENPQIVAVVVAHLPPRQAADLLRHFEPRLQASLLRRIAELDTTDMDVLREVEKYLKMLLHDDLRAARSREIGLSTVASILTAAGEARHQLVSSLTHHDRQLAHQLRNPARRTTNAAEDAEQKRQHHAVEKQHAASRLPDRGREAVAAHQRAPTSRIQTDGAPSVNEAVAITFEELSGLSDAQLAVVFRESDSKLALLALAGATPEFVNRLLKQLPAREAKSLRRRMEQLGPLRLSDVEQAQATIARIASRLIDAGALDRPHLAHITAAA